MLNSALPFLTLVAVVLVPVTSESAQHSPYRHQRAAKAHCTVADCSLVGRQTAEHLTAARR
jgi:hypothetical protein